MVIGNTGDGGQLSEWLVAWAQLDYPIMIRGAYGTGKTRLARQLHDASPRARHPWVPLSLGALAGGIETSALFGVKKGAFTDASSDEPGTFRAADRGTAFLDELDRGSPRTFALLTVALNEPGRMRIPRVGDARTTEVSVPVIAATAADLETLVADGRFPRDLMDRFGFYTVRLRPLRERRAEIRPLVLATLAAECGRYGMAVPTVEPRAWELLHEAPWHGNVRELLNVCRYMVGTGAAVVRMEDLPPAFLATLGLTLEDADAGMERRVRRALDRNGGNKSRAARDLGCSRSHIHRVLGRRNAAPSESSD